MTLLQAARHCCLTDPSPIVEAIRVSGRWIAELVMRAAAVVKQSATGPIPLHAWRSQVKVRAELLAPRPHSMHTGSDVLKHTVRALSDIVGGRDPMQVAAEALKLFPGGAGLQIAEDALAAWIRRDRRSRLRFAA